MTFDKLPVSTLKDEIVRELGETVTEVPSDLPRTIARREVDQTQISKINLHQGLDTIPQKKLPLLVHKKITPL